MRTSTVVLAAALAGCGAAEREELRSRTAAAEAAKDAADAQLSKERSRGDQAEVRAKSLEGKLEAALREAAQFRGDADTARQEAAKQREEAKKALEPVEKKLKDVTLHRDELVEWIEGELLPAAEEKDPRLANLRDATKEVATLVENARGLKFKQPFMRRLIRREQVGQWMLRDMKRELPEDEAKKLVTVGTVFGLVQEKTDLYSVMSGMLEAGAAAFYKPETGTFYLIEGNDGRGARPIVFHELVHALEDQYFDLTAFYKTVEQDSDMSLARRGLVEGSACHFAAIYEREHPDDVRAMQEGQSTPDLVQKQARMMATVPPVLIATIGIYPYHNAPAWLAAIHADDVAALERLYADPPVSTEQVLHPEKFPLEGPRDYPHVVGVPDVAAALGQGWENVDDDSVGELQTGILLSQLRWEKYQSTLLSILDVPTETVSFKDPVKNAVEGWDGDRYTAWIQSESGAVTVVWVSVWDSETDARQFAETYGDRLGGHVLGKGFTARPSPIRYENPKTHTVSGIDVSGTRVVAVLDAPADKLDALFAAGAKTKVEADPRDPNDK